MRKIGLTYAIIPILVFFMVCAGSTSLVDFVKEGGLETSGLTNLALASNGAVIIVSQENPDHPSSALNNGVTSSEKWDQGEGWESEYNGRLARGRSLHQSRIEMQTAHSHWQRRSCFG